MLVHGIHLADHDKPKKKERSMCLWQPHLDGQDRTAWKETRPIKTLLSFLALEEENIAETQHFSLFPNQQQRRSV